MEPQVPSSNSKLRLLCSYGGRIMPLPPTNSLKYIGGETRIVAVPRDVSFPVFFKLLSKKLISGFSFSLRYRLPGCDLDSLISVSDDEDLRNMIAECVSTSFQRIRLFLFPLNHPEPTQITPPDNGRPAQRVDHNNKVDATEEEAPTTSASLLWPENTVADDGKGDSDREREKVEIQDQSQSQPIVQELLPQQQPLIVYYVPVLAVQPHIVTHPVSPCAVSPANHYSSGNQE